MPELNAPPWRRSSRRHCCWKPPPVLAPIAPRLTFRLQLLSYFSFVFHIPYISLFSKPFPILLLSRILAPFLLEEVLPGTDHRRPPVVLPSYFPSTNDLSFSLSVLYNSFVPSHFFKCHHSFFPHILSLRYGPSLFRILHRENLWSVFNGVSFFFWVTPAAERLLATGRGAPDVPPGLRPPY